MQVDYCMQIRVYYEDTDGGGVVYYANYLKFMERCRTEWLRRVGFDIRDIAQDQGVVFVVRSAAVDYLKPARLSDLLEVSVTPKRIGRVSLEVEQNVRRGKELICRGHIKLASLDARTFSPSPIPSKLLAGINTWKTS